MRPCMHPRYSCAVPFGANGRIRPTPHYPDNGMRPKPRMGKGRHAWERRGLRLVATVHRLSPCFCQALLPSLGSRSVISHHPFSPSVPTAQSMHPPQSAPRPPFMPPPLSHGHMWRCTAMGVCQLWHSAGVDGVSAFPPPNGGMFAWRAPGACPARYLCIQYPISSPKFILTLGSPPN